MLVPETSNMTNMDSLAHTRVDTIEQDVTGTVKFQLYNVFYTIYRYFAYFHCRLTFDKFCHLYGNIFGEY